jgi:hypothetical protein
MSGLADIPGRRGATGRNRARTRALVAVAGLIGACAILAVADPKALCLLPVLALATPLLLRRYPGERVLLSRLGTPVAPRRRRATSSRRWALAPRTLVPRGGLLVASSLAVRPPPPLAVAG